MNDAKIRLSQKEKELVNNTEWILAKNIILFKVRNLLIGLQQKQQEHLPLHMFHLPQEIGKPLPKISKGENYQGLPYLILDFPRFFEPGNIFAIRTMFWWGNFFSIALLLSGSSKKMFEEKIITSYPILKEKEFYYCVHDQPWEHHFEIDNYVMIPEISKDDFETSVCRNSFIKLAQKIPLQQWEGAPKTLFSYFKQFIEMMRV